MTNVRIVKLGPIPEELALARVAKMANRPQEQYYFTVGDDLGVMTEPDAEREQYTCGTLAERLGVREGDGADLLVGITDHRVYDELFSAVTEDLTCIIVSTADVRDVIDTDRTSMAGYVLFEIAAELLTIEYRRLARTGFDPTVCGLPWHLVRKSCLFDYDDERKHTGEKILKPHLCAACQSLLRDAGVAPSIERAALRIAGAGLAPVRALLRRWALHRWFALVTGFTAGQFGMPYGLGVLAIAGVVMFMVERQD